MLIRTPYIYRTFGAFRPLFLSQISVYIGLGATQEEKPYVLILIIEFTQEDITSHQYDNLCGNFENWHKSVILKTTPSPKWIMWRHPGGSWHLQLLGEPGSSGRSHSWESIPWQIIFYTYFNSELKPEISCWVSGMTNFLICFFFLIWQFVGHLFLVSAGFSLSLPFELRVKIHVF